MLRNTGVDRGLEVVVRLPVLTDSLDQTLNEQELGCTAPYCPSGVTINCSHEGSTKKSGRVQLEVLLNSRANKKLNTTSKSGNSNNMYRQLEIIHVYQTDPYILEI
jgi:hypothetical protein